MHNVHEWRTSITKVTADDIIVRGVDIRDLITSHTFTETSFLALRGRFPSRQEAKMFDAALSSLVDHGFVSSHVTAARFIVSGHPNVVAGIAGGVLAAGPNTLSPESAAEFIDRALQRHHELGGTIEETATVVVAETIKKGERIAGFGHVNHKNGDPRTVALRAVAAENGFIGKRVELYEAIHREFLRVKKRNLPINADGMLAAVLGEMDWSPREMAGLAVMASLPGLLAHVVEEITTGAPHRFMPEEQVVYFEPGPSDRDKR
jgi:citryl-CoA lyase